jgi:hypothetical protein
MPDADVSLTLETEVSLTLKWKLSGANKLLFDMAQKLFTSQKLFHPVAMT